jgi:hypothetical protein
MSEFGDEDSVEPPSEDPSEDSEVDFDDERDDDQLPLDEAETSELGADLDDPEKLSEDDL